MRKINAFLLITLVLLACSPIRTWADKAGPLIQEYFDTVAVADNTSRMSLAPVISDMQRIRREMQRLDAPAEAEPTHQAITSAMEHTTNCYIDFLGSGDNNDVSECISDAEDLWNHVSDALDELADTIPSDD